MGKLERKAIYLQPGLPKNKPLRLLTLEGVGEVNNSHVKIFKAKGEFVWHSHQDEDEFFLVVKGQLNIKMRDQEVCLKEGEFFIVPKGVEHLPYADEEAHVLLFEPKAVINTGNTISEKTVEEPEWI